MNNWRQDKPVPQRYVYVWGDCTNTVSAYWTGKVWRNAAGKIVHDVTHWREVPVSGVTTAVSGGTTIISGAC